MRNGDSAFMFSKEQRCCPSKVVSKIPHVPPGDYIGSSRKVERKWCYVRHRKKL